jgi:hypothetical protein
MLFRRLRSPLALAPERMQGVAQPRTPGKLQMRCMERRVPDRDTDVQELQVCGERPGYGQRRLQHRIISIAAANGH